MHFQCILLREETICLHNVIIRFYHPYPFPLFHIPFIIIKFIGKHIFFKLNLFDRFQYIFRNYLKKKMK